MMLSLLVPQIPAVDSIEPSRTHGNARTSLIESDKGVGALENVAIFTSRGLRATLRRPSLPRLARHRMIAGTR